LRRNEHHLPTVNKGISTKSGGELTKRWALARQLDVVVTCVLYLSLSYQLPILVRQLAKNYHSLHLLFIFHVKGGISLSFPKIKKSITNKGA
jgi:hypothetical protein